MSLYQVVLYDEEKPYNRYYSILKYIHTHKLFTSNIIELCENQEGFFKVD